MSHCTVLLVAALAVFSVISAQRVVPPQAPQPGAPQPLPQQTHQNNQQQANPLGVGCEENTCRNKCGQAALIKLCALNICECLGLGGNPLGGLLPNQNQPAPAQNSPQPPSGQTPPPPPGQPQNPGQGGADAPQPRGLLTDVLGKIL